MNEENKKLLRDQVLEAIKSGGVKMRPKWHFVLKTILALIGGAILLLTALYLVSFIFFMLRQTGVWFAPVPGFRGWYALFISLPWLLVFLLIAFIAVLEVLVRRYSFAYRRPLLYSAALIAFLVIMGGYAVAGTSFHRRMFRYAERNELPVAGGFYREYGHQRFRNIHKGVVDEKAENSLVIKDRQGDKLTVLMTPETRLDPDAGFSKGDMVVIFGDRDDHTIRALGIRKIDADGDFDAVRR